MVDFLTRSPDGETHLIQVCADVSAPEAAARELRAFEGSRALHPEARLWLLMLTRDGAPAEVPKGIAIQPAYQWMLADHWTSTPDKS